MRIAASLADGALFKAKVLGHNAGWYNAGVSQPVALSTPRQSLSYDSIAINQQLTVQRTISAEQVALFAAASDDCNPVHLDAGYAANTDFGRPIAHGMLTGALISAAIATHLPGPGSIYRSQQIKFQRPVFCGDIVDITLTVTAKRDRARLITLSCEVVNQDDQRVASGEAEVIVAPDVIETGAIELPAITVQGAQYHYG